MRTAAAGLLSLGLLMGAAIPARAAEGGAQGTLRVASVNMWGIPHVSTFIDERFTALAERLAASDIDVVGLQEMWADGPRARFLARIADAFPYGVDFQGETGGSGLVILSRHPIVTHDFRRFSLNGKPWKIFHGDWFGRKGVGLARIRTPAGDVWFATTHLHATYGSPPTGPLRVDGEYGLDRWRQMQTVRQFVRAHAGDLPAIVVGDFNLTRDQIAYAALRGGLPTNAVAGGPEPPWTDAALRRGDGRIDYIWIRPGARGTWRIVQPTTRIFAEPVSVAGAQPQPLTDHPAVAAVVEYANPAPAWRADPTWAGRGDAAALGLGAALLRPEPYGGKGTEFLVVFAVGLGLAIAGGGLLGPWRASHRSALRVLRRVAGVGVLAAGLLCVYAVAAQSVRRARAYDYWRRTAPSHAPLAGAPAQPAEPGENG